MRTFYFYKSIRKTIIQFLDLFNDIYVARYDNAGNVIKTVMVPVKFGPKEKAYSYKTEYSTEEKLPIISCVLRNIDFDESRMTNKYKNIRVSVNTTNKTLTQYVTPVPYNFLFDVTIWSLHIVDIDQILEQILPFFNPYVMIRSNIPELDTTYDIKVLFQSATPEVSEDFGEEDWRILKWTLTFNIQTYLFKPLTTTAEDGEGGGYIEKIGVNMYTNRESFDDRETTTTMVCAAPSGAAEMMYIEGISWNESESEPYYIYEIFE
jgi:hypothetical protein